MSERDANQLAADVRRAINYAKAKTVTGTEDYANLRRADAALDELVALVGTLQQERDEWRDLAAKEARAGIARDKERMAAAALAEKDAALTNMTGWHNEAQARANELEAALATTRQALKWIAQTSPDRTASRAARRALADTGGDTAEAVT